MIFTIRKRMLINIVQLMLPMCLFVFFLYQEVQGQINFAQRERTGLRVQTLILDVLADAYRIEASSNKMRDSVRATGEQLVASLRENATQVGFSGQALNAAQQAAFAAERPPANWSQAVVLLEQYLAAYTAPSEVEGSATALTSALHAMLLRVGDGSNLTLDPDLDSYYVMDAFSFALADALANISHAQADLRRFASQRPAGLLPKQNDAVAVWVYRVTGDPAFRVVNSLQTAIVEDANFYGISETLPALADDIDRYQKAVQALKVTLAAYRDPLQPVDIAQLDRQFDAVRMVLADLQLRLPGAMDALLQARIMALKAHQHGLLAQGLGATLVGLFLFWLISRSIVRPVNALRDAMLRIAAGHLEDDVPFVRRRDEIGQMAQAVVVFRQNSLSLRSLAGSFEQSVKQIADVVVSSSHALHGTAEEQKRMAQNGHASMQSIRHNTEHLMQDMQSVSSASDQLLAAISEISRQVHRSNDTTGHAVDEAAHVRQVAENLMQAAQKVSGIVGIIQGIASRITLLAMNATIEASRAGEVGKGFAVVAEEVKLLASQTAQATKEISQLVQAMGTSSNETLSAIGQITGIVDEINQISNVIAAAVEEQGAATRDISGAIRAAHERVVVVSGSIHESIQDIEKASESADITATSSAQLSEQAARLNAEISDFMHAIHDPNSSKLAL